MLWMSLSRFRRWCNLRLVYSRDEEGQDERKHVHFEGIHISIYIGLACHRQHNPAIAIFVIDEDTEDAKTNNAPAPQLKYIYIYIYFCRENQGPSLALYCTHNGGKD